MSFCSTLAGCQNRNSIRNSGLSAPFSVVYHSVPFATGDSVWDEAQLLEKDKYGRELYLYLVSPDTYMPARDLVGSKKISFHILVICQKTENGQVFYYEDQCYLILQSENYSDDEVQAIKLVNDWNKPYEISKMISVENTFDQSLAVNEEECIKAFSEAVDIDDKYKLVFDAISVENGESLCVIRAYYTETAEDNSKNYFFTANYVVLFDQKNELIRYSTFEGSFEDFPTQIKLLKRQDIAQGT